MPTIDEVFAEFLDEQRSQLADSTFVRYEEVIDLFSISMNGYAANGLTEEEFARWQERYEVDEESAFTGLFGPDKIAENLGEFLDYFMIRKVMANKELLNHSGTVTKKLAQWLAAKGHVDAATAAHMANRAGDASTELPAVDQLADLLYADARRAPRFDADDIPDDHWVDDYLTIIKIESGKLWFDGLNAPMAVSAQSSAAARIGWTVNVEAVKLGSEWHLVGVGNVYP